MQTFFFRPPVCFGESSIADCSDTYLCTQGFEDMISEPCDPPGVEEICRHEDSACFLRMDPSPECQKFVMRTIAIGSDKADLGFRNTVSNEKLSGDFSVRENSPG